ITVVPILQLHVHKTVPIGYTLRFIFFTISFETLCSDFESSIYFPSTSSILIQGIFPLNSVGLSLIGTIILVLYPSLVTSHSSGISPIHSTPESLYLSYLLYLLIS